MSSAEKTRSQSPADPHERLSLDGGHRDEAAPARRPRRALTLSEAVRVASRLLDAAA
jgi:hypothetical protein